MLPCSLSSPQTLAESQGMRPVMQLAAELPRSYQVIAASNCRSVIGPVGICHVITAKQSGLCLCRDRVMINNLRSGVLLHNDAWSQELDLMEEWDCKAELEALYNVYGFAGFSEVLAQRVVDQRYLR